MIVLRDFRCQRSYTQMKGESYTGLEQQGSWVGEARFIPKSSKAAIIWLSWYSQGSRNVQYESCSRWIEFQERKLLIPPCLSIHLPSSDLGWKWCLEISSHLVSMRWLWGWKASTFKNSRSERQKGAWDVMDTPLQPLLISRKTLMFQHCDYLGIWGLCSSTTTKYDF